jgi:hypothetical protein
MVSLRGAGPAETSGGKARDPVPPEYSIWSGDLALLAASLAWGWLASWTSLKIVYLLMRWLFSQSVLVVRGDPAKTAELLVLRHENAVLRRTAGRVRYEPGDRAWFAALTPFVPRRRWGGVFPVTPATLLAGHRRLRRKEIRHQQTASARPSADDPEYRPACRSPGRREPALGLPADPRRAGQAGRIDQAGQINPRPATLTSATHRHLPIAAGYEGLRGRDRRRCRHSCQDSGAQRRRRLSVAFGEHSHDQFAQRVGAENTITSRGLRIFVDQACGVPELVQNI